MRYSVTLKRETYMTNMERKDSEMDLKPKDSVTSSICSAWAEEDRMTEAKRK